MAPCVLETLRGDNLEQKENNESTAKAVRRENTETAQMPEIPGICRGRQTNAAYFSIQFNELDALRIAPFDVRMLKILSNQ